MKIQSMLLLAAMVGSADAANTRKRVFKIYSQEEIRAYEGARALQAGDKGDKGQAGQPAASMSMSMASTTSTAAAATTSAATTTMAMSMPADVCAFCDGGMTVDPATKLPQGQTCETAMGFAMTILSSAPECDIVKQAEPICCPVATSSTVASTTAASTTAASTTAASTETTTAAASAASTTSAGSMPITTAAGSMPTTTVASGTTEAAAPSTTTEEPKKTTTTTEAPKTGASYGVTNGAMIMGTTAAGIAVAGAMMLV